MSSEIKIGMWVKKNCNYNNGDIYIIISVPEDEYDNVGLISIGGVIVGKRKNDFWHSYTTYPFKEIFATQSKTIEEMKAILTGWVSACLCEGDAHCAVCQSTIDYLQTLEDKG